MAQIPAYRKLGIQGFSVPGTSFAGLKEQANMFNSLNQKISSVVSYANEQSSKQIMRDAEKFAVENPISVDHFYEANPAEKAKLLKERGANDETVKGQTIKATLMNLLSTDIVIKAKTQLNQIYDESVENFFDPTVAIKPDADSVIKKLNATIQGYTDSLINIDPATAIKLKAELGIAGNTHLRNFSNKVLTETISQNEASVETYAYEEINTLKNIISAGPTDKFTIDQQLGTLKINLQQMLIDNGKGAIVDTWSKAFDKEVINAKKNYLFENFIDKPENINPSTAVSIYKNVLKGSFNFDVDGYKSIYESLPEDKQKEFRNSVKEWKDNVIKIFEDEDKALELENTDAISNLEARYYGARFDNDFEEAKLVVQEARQINDKLFIELSQQLDADDDGGEFVDQEVLENLSNDLLITKDLTHTKIQEARDAGNITLDQKIKLDADLQTSKTKAFQIGDRYMRNAFGYSEATIIRQNVKDRASANLYREKSNDLLDWIREHPDATSADIEAKVLDLTNNVNIDALKKISLKDTKSNIKNTYGLVNSSWKSYFKNFYNQKYTDINQEFLNDSAGIDILIDELEELKGMKEGELLSDNFDFGTGLRDKEFARPRINGKPVTNDQINLIIEELETLRELYEDIE